MSRTPARITQADAARIIRAAKLTGADSVRFFARRHDPDRLASA